MNTKRFSSPRASTDSANEEWKALTTRTFTDFELEQFDIKLEAYNFLRTVAEHKRFYIDMGAAHWGYPPNDTHLIYMRDSKHPNELCIERIDNKIAQWSKWRAKKFPASRVRNYAQMAREAMAHRHVIHHSDSDVSLGELAREFDS